MTESSIWWCAFFIAAAIVTSVGSYYKHRETILKAAHKAKMLDAQLAGLQALSNHHGDFKIGTDYWENW